MDSFEILPVFWPYLVIEWTESHQIWSLLTEFCYLPDSFEVYHLASFRQTSQDRAANWHDFFNSPNPLTSISKRPHLLFLKRMAPKAPKKEETLSYKWASNSY